MNERTDQGMNTQPKGSPVPRSRRIPWLPLLFAALTVVTYFMVSAEMQGGRIMYGVEGTAVSTEVAPATPPSPIPSPSYPMNFTPQDNGNVTEEAPSRAVSAGPTQVTQGMMTVTSAGTNAYYSPGYPVPPPYYYGQPSATDTREFLKTSYQASVRTMHVQDLTRRIETTIRGHGGRVDQESSSPDYGSVSFVVPADKFDDFRTEFEGMVNWRFLSVSVSAENLLPQKQEIEGAQSQTQSSLADLTASRKKLVATHASTVATLQAEIDADTKELATLRAQTSTDPTQEASIAAQMQTVLADQASFKSRLANENSNYTYNLQNIDSSIKYTQANLGNIQTQDQNLTANVATVNGTISLSSITLWQIAMLYLPGYSIPTIFAILTVLSYFWDRRRHGPSILGF